MANPWAVKRVMREGCPLACVNSRIHCWLGAWPRRTAAHRVLASCWGLQGKGGRHKGMTCCLRELKHM